jgi:hypothetical protein
VLDGFPGAPWLELSQWPRVRQNCHRTTGDTAALCCVCPLDILENLPITVWPSTKKEYTSASAPQKVKLPRASVPNKILQRPNLKSGYLDSCAKLQYLR